MKLYAIKSTALKIACGFYRGVVIGALILLFIHKAHAATVGHRVAVGRGTVGAAVAPVIVLLAVVRSPFTNSIMSFLVPTSLDTNKLWTLQQNANLANSNGWTAVTYVDADGTTNVFALVRGVRTNGWGVIKNAPWPACFYRLKGQ